MEELFTKSYFFTIVENQSKIFFEKLGKIKIFTLDDFLSFNNKTLIESDNDYDIFDNIEISFKVSIDSVVRINIMLFLYEKYGIFIPVSTITKNKIKNPKLAERKSYNKIINMQSFYNLCSFYNITISDCKEISGDTLIKNLNKCSKIDKSNTFRMFTLDELANYNTKVYNESNGKKDIFDYITDEISFGSVPILQIIGELKRLGYGYLKLGIYTRKYILKKKNLGTNVSICRNYDINMEILSS